MPRHFRLFRYRKPSLGEIIGTTQAKRRISRQLGLATLRDPLHPVKNMERRAKTRVGYYSEPMKFARKMGCFRVIFLSGFTLAGIAINLVFGRAGG